MTIGTFVCTRANTALGAMNLTSEKGSCGSWSFPKGSQSRGIDRQHLDSAVTKSQASVQRTVTKFPEDKSTPPTF